MAGQAVGWAETDNRQARFIQNRQRTFISVQIAADNRQHQGYVALLGNAAQMLQIGELAAAVAD